MTDQNNTYGEFVIVPQTAPMGWVASPYGAQSITWSLVLLTPSTHKPPGINFGSLSKHQLPFTWIPLSAGGGIFVILDNILVVSWRGQCLVR